MACRFESASLIVTRAGGGREGGRLNVNARKENPTKEDTDTFEEEET